MGQNPQDDDFTIGFTCQFDLRLPDAKIVTLMKTFVLLLPTILADFIQKCLVGYGELVMVREVKPFRCRKCRNNERFIWKTRHGKPTKILTLFSWVTINQLQVQCQRCGGKFYLTRFLLGMEPGERIPAWIRRKLGLLGALSPYRVAKKFLDTFGATVDKMTIWRCVQKIGHELTFALDPDECAAGEADGTGIGIRGIKKRGKELKVFIQYKKDGGVRVAGVDIGNYNGQWGRLFKKSLPALRTFKSFLLLTDGDTAIFDALTGKVKVLLQRCLWHVPHQLKYTLWKDKKAITRKSPEWLHIMGKVHNICGIRSGVDDDEVIKAMVDQKKKDLEDVVAYCRKIGATHSADYLENARDHLFTSLQNRLEGKTTSRVERVFRTVNMRIDVGKWTTNGALNVTKVRLAYYYNGFDT